jgi:hypothetical protein
LSAGTNFREDFVLVDRGANHKLWNALSQ